MAEGEQIHLAKQSSGSIRTSVSVVMLIVLAILFCIVVIAAYATTEVPVRCEGRLMLPRQGGVMRSTN